jgi:predicted kinase
MTARTYRRLLELARPLIGDGVPVVLDATYLSRAHRSEGVEMARRAGVAATIVHCTAPRDVLQKRLSARTGDVADATAVLLPSQANALESFSDAEAAILLTVDTTHPFDPAFLRRDS